MRILQGKPAVFGNSVCLVLRMVWAFWLPREGLVAPHICPASLGIARLLRFVLSGLRYRAMTGEMPSIVLHRVITIRTATGAVILLLTTDAANEGC